LRSVLNREWAWGVAAVVAATALWLLDPGGSVERLRESAFEAMGVVFPREEAPGRVMVVDVDRDSLARLGPWPWRRSVMADLVERVAAAGPRAVAVDILLSGADRKGPAALARELAQLSGRADLDPATFEDDDERLAAAIVSAGKVVLGVVLDDAGTDPAPLPAPFAAEGAAAGIIPHSASGLLAPFEPFAAGAAGFGVLSFQDGPLGRVASAPVIAVAAGETFPGLALEAVRVAEGAAILVLKDAPSRVAAGPLAVPLDRRAEMRLHFGPASAWARRTVPAWQVLAPGREPAPLAGTIVLIGSSAPEAGAFLPAAGAALAPTVQIQAEAIEQMLSGRFLSRPAFALPWEVLAMAALGLLAVTLAAQLSPLWTAIAALGLVLCWSAAALTAFARYGILVDPLGPPLSALLGANVTAFAAFVRTRALKNAIVQRFERYVPPEVVARFVREPETLRLDGELREVTALLTDVEGFSRMTENSDPRALVALLDDYFDTVTELVVVHGGMVDKIVGDAVLAFFNIPAPLSGHAGAAIRCAQAIVAATEAFRGKPDAALMQFGRTRCGIESGPAIVGDVGGRRRLDYTAYGVVVNKAARFQEANKTLRSAICIGPVAASMAAADHALRPLGRIVVRGMQGECEVYEPWGEGVPPEVRELYAHAASLQAEDPARARQLFAELAPQLPDDPVIAGWLERLPA
jgi:adenylate cyclase